MNALHPACVQQILLHSGELKIMAEQLTRLARERMNCQYRLAADAKTSDAWHYSYLFSLFTAETTKMIPQMYHQGCNRSTRLFHLLAQYASEIKVGYED